VIIKLLSSIFQIILSIKLLKLNSCYCMRITMQAMVLGLTGGCIHWLQLFDTPEKESAMALRKQAQQEYSRKFRVKSNCYASWILSLNQTPCSSL